MARPTPRWQQAQLVEPARLPHSSSMGARVLALPIHAYRKLGAGRPSPCRFDPSCSTYALQSLHEHGALRGSWLTVRRLARCHPWGGHGWDPVPTSTPVAEPSFPLTNRKVFDV